MTTEVPGLAEALRRPGIALDIEMHLTDETQHRALSSSLMRSDPALRPERAPVRNETRDARRPVEVP